MSFKKPKSAHDFIHSHTTHTHVLTDMNFQDSVVITAYCTRNRSYKTDHINVDKTQFTKRQGFYDVVFDYLTVSEYNSHMKSSFEI